jgi:hypothetical protein
VWRWDKAWAAQPLAVSLVGVAVIELALVLPYPTWGDTGLAFVSALTAFGGAGIAGGLLAAADRHLAERPWSAATRLIERRSVRSGLGLARAVSIALIGIVIGLGALWAAGQSNAMPLQVAGVLVGGAVALTVALLSWDRAYNRPTDKTSGDESPLP